MIYSGTFVKLVDSKSGDRKDGKGTWQLATFVVREKDINIFEAWGKEAEIAKELKDGDKVTVDFYPSTREVNGRYYVSLKVNSIMTDVQVNNEDVKETNSTKPFGQPTIPDDSGLPF